MTAGQQLGLTEKHLNSFDRFLLDSTGNVLSALEAMLGFTIESSNSTIEIAPADENENLKNVGDGVVYTVSSDIEGDMQGSVLMLMRAGDFNHLGEVMRPILGLMFLSSPDVDLAELDKQKPGWMQDPSAEGADIDAYKDQMMDTFTEMGNLIIGLYSKGIYKICDVNTHHTVPKATKDSEQEIIHRLLSSPGASDRFHLVIENEFMVMEKPIKIWCLISPTEKSFQHILDGIEVHDERRIQ